MKLSTSQKGAVMTEFSIVAFLFVIILGFFFDILLIYFKNQALVNTTSRAARAFAINYPVVNTQSEITAAVRTYISNNFFLDASGIVVTVETSPVPNSGLCSLKVEATWPNACIFCFFPDFYPQSHGEAIIEDECLLACS